MALILAATVVGLAAGIGVSLQSRSDRGQDPSAVPGLLWPQPRALDNFRLVDQYDTPFGLDRLKGKWSFLFFGFTHCPDVCPLTLAALAGAHRELGNHPGLADDLQTIFVSVDPERDSREQLADYVAYFDPAFLGLTGTPEAVDDFARNLGILHVKVPGTGGAGDYTIDHSASVLLVDPAGRLVGIFSAPHDADKVVTQYQAIRRFIEARS